MFYELSEPLLYKLTLLGLHFEETVLLSAKHLVSEHTAHIINRPLCDPKYKYHPTFFGRVIFILLRQDFNAVFGFAFFEEFFSEFGGG